MAPSRYVSMQSLIAGQWFALSCARSVKRPPSLVSVSHAITFPTSRWDAHTDSVISILALTRRCKPGGGGSRAAIPYQKHEHPAGCSPEIGCGRDHGLPLTLTRARRTKDQNDNFSISNCHLVFLWLFCEDVVRCLDTCPV
jgi:hypothetical protein